MVAPVAVAWLLVLGATGDLMLDANVRLVESARRTVLGSLPPQATTTRLSSTSGETELAPRFTLSRDGPLLLSLSYGPRLLLPVDVSGGAPELREWGAMQRSTLVLHEGQFAAHARTGTWTASGIAKGSYGDTDFLSREGTVAQPVVTTYRIPYMSGQAIASITAERSRRMSYSVEGGASFSGGADARARETLPLQRALRLDASLQWHATRRDVASAVLSGAGSSVESAGDAAYLGAGGGWRHLIRPDLAVRSAAGLAATFARHPATSGAVPWAQASLAYTPDGARPSAELRLSAEPGIDRVTGAVDLTTTADARAHWEPAAVWSFDARAAVTALRGWSGTDTFGSGGGPYTLVGKGELSATRRLREKVAISTGILSRAQRTDRTDLPGFREVAGFVEITAGARARIQ